MQCVKCHREIPDDANLCCYCGRVIVKRRANRTRPNGAGSARRRGNVWQAAVTVGYVRNDATGIWRPKTATKSGFATKREALEYCPTLRQEALARLEQPAQPAIMQEPKTIAFYWAIIERQLEASGVSKLSAYRYAYNRLKPLWLREVATLSVAELQHIVDTTTSTYYPAKDVKTVLHKIYALALRDEAVTMDKSAAITLPKLEEESGEPFTQEELRLQWEAYDHGYTFLGYVLIMDYTGMMPGELLSCRKDMIDFEARRIIGAGKKTKKRREAPIVFPDFLAPVLHAMCDHSKSAKLCPMAKDSFYAAFHNAMREIGCRDLPPYSCRHTTGTALALGGQVAPAVIQQIMRHSRFTSTERYIHPSYDAANEAIDTLARP